MSLDLGAVVGRVLLETAQFDRAYLSATRKMAQFGTQAEKSSGGVRQLDVATRAAGASADKASVGIARAGKAATETGAGMDRAAKSTTMAGRSAKDAAVAFIAAGEGTARQRTATLGLIAAQERLDAVMAAGTASTSQYARAQAAVVAAEERVTTANRAAAASTARVGAAQTEAGAAGGVMARGLTRTRTALADVTGVSAKAAGGLGLVIGAFFSIKSVIGIGNEFTDALNGVQAASHATDAQMRAVSKQAVAMGRDLTIPKATAVDAAQAIDDLVRSGMTLPRAMTAARPALLLAAAAQVSTADAARFLGDTLDDFQLPAQKAAHVANVLAGASTSAGGGLTDMFDAIKYAGPFARAVGVSVDDLTTAVALLAKGGIQGSMAGTGLRMMLQSLAKVTPASRKALDDLGVTAFDAAGKFVGLPKVIDQLHTAQKRLNPQQFLADISKAFGARAATVVASFAHKGIDAWNLFAKRVESGDVQKYANLMNRGIGAGFRQLGKEATAAGLSIYQKFQPSINAAVQWLGTNLPKAVQTLGTILAPIIHVIGEGFAAAWTVAGGAIKFAANALGTVGHLAASNSGVIKDLGTAALFSFAAFKGATVAAALLSGLGDVLVALRLKAMNTVIALRAVAAGEKEASAAQFATGLAIAGVAVYAFGKTVSSLLERGNSVAFMMDHLTAIEGSFRTALEASNGALTDHVRLTVGATLQSAGLAGKAAAAGISLKDLTAAVTGSDAAMSGLIKRWKASGTPADSTIVALGELHGAYKKTAGDAATLSTVTTAGAAAQKRAAAATAANAKVTQYSIDTHGQLIASSVKAGSAIDNTTTAMTAQTIASGILKNALDALNGVNETVEQTTDAFNISVGNLAAKQGLATDANGKMSTSLKQNTVAGATNRQMLAGIIDNAKADAQAVADQAKKHHSLSDALTIGNARLASNEAKIRSAAAAAGFNKQQTDALIRSIGQLNNAKADPSVDAKTDPAQAKINAIQKRINAIQQGKVPGLSLNSHDGERVVATLQREINALKGKTIDIHVETSSSGQKYRYVPGSGVIPVATGGYIRGPGTGTSDSIPARLSNGEFVTNAKQTAKHLPLLHAINAGVQGFASGGLVGNAKNIAAALSSMLGLDRSGIAGVLGNLKIESGFNPRAVGGPAHGIAQWQDSRWAALQAFARSHNRSATNLKIQEEFVAKELRGMPGLLHTLRTGRSSTNDASLFDQIFERSDGTARGARMSAAAGFARALRNTNLSSGSGGGGGVGQVSGSGKDWVYGGIHYASQRAADNARERAQAADLKAERKKQQEHQAAVLAAARADVRVATLTHASVAKLFGVGPGGTARGGVVGASDIVNQLAPWEKALAKAGVPKPAMQQLTKDNRFVYNAAVARNKVAGQLMTAQKNLQSAIAGKTADTASFRSAVVGTFDITSAGADANGNVAGGAIMAQEAQAVTRAKAWVAGIKKLAGLKVFPGDFLRQLAAKGPDALPEVQALSHMSLADLTVLRSNELELSSLGQQAGVIASRRLDDPGIAKYSAQVKALEARELALQRNLVKDLDKTLAAGMHDLKVVVSHMKIDWKTGTLSSAVATDAKKLAHGRGHS